MASAETYFVSLLGAAAWAGGAYLAVRYVIPQIVAMLSDVLKYAKAVNAFGALLTVWVYVVAAGGIISRIGGIGEKLTNYAVHLQPAVDVLNGFVPYVEWFVLGVGLVIIAERLKFR